MVEYKSVWGFRSVVFICQVQEGAAAAWMDLGLVMELEELWVSPSVTEDYDTLTVRGCLLWLASIG